MLSSILFQDLGEKAGSFESFTQNGGYIQTPDDLNERVLFDDLAASTIKHGSVVDGAESEVSNSRLKLASPPSSRAVNDDESAYVSKREVNMDVSLKPKNLSFLNLKADDDGQVDASVQDTTVDVSTLYMSPYLILLRQLFLTLLLLV